MHSSHQYIRRLTIGGVFVDGVLYLGVSICHPKYKGDDGDNFSRKEGRLRAKNNVKKLLKITDLQSKMDSLNPKQAFGQEKAIEKLIKDLEASTLGIISFPVTIEGRETSVVGLKIACEGVESKTFISVGQQMMIRILKRAKEVDISHVDNTIRRIQEKITKLTSLKAACEALKNKLNNKTITHDTHSKQVWVD